MDIPEESDKARQAFNDYLLMGSGRSLQKLLDSYKERPKGDQSAPSVRLATLKRWSSEHQWQERVSEYEKQEQEAEEQVWRDRRKEWRRQQFDLKEKILGRITAMLGFPLTEIEREFERAGPDGTQRVTQIIRPAGWSYRDLAAVLRELRALGVDVLPADLDQTGPPQVEKRIITYTRGPDVIPPQQILDPEMEIFEEEEDDDED